METREKGLMPDLGRDRCSSSSSRGGKAEGHARHGTAIFCYEQWTLFRKARDRGTCVLMLIVEVEVDVSVHVIDLRRKM